MNDPWYFYIIYGICIAISTNVSRDYFDARKRRRNLKPQMSHYICRIGECDLTVSGPNAETIARIATNHTNRHVEQLTKKHL